MLVHGHNSHALLRIFTVAMVFVTSFTSFNPVAVQASHTSTPTAVTIAGSLQSELGCSGDWQANCAATHLTYDASDAVWQGMWVVPAGNYEYKAALNDDWAENYGQNATPNGANIVLTASGSVKFYYDHKSHWVTDNINSVIAVAPGNFQSELGCGGDWDPSCLRSWLQDVDGDGTYTFETTALPAGTYEGKVALNESWDVNYGAGGVQNGPNLVFTVPTNNAQVKFSYNATSHVLTIQAGHAPDNNVEWAGLRHDSRDPLYRTPGGAVTAGTPVIVRFRTFHNDVTSVKVRVYDLNANGQKFLDMAPVATAVSCYQVGLENEMCDFWAATLTEADPNNLWYRFVVSDGSDTDYYGDNTAALDGGLGATTDEVEDRSYALMFYDAAFTAPNWARSAVIYQIFPDRFRNGAANNDPQTGDPRYDDPVLQLSWNTLPEGYCRNYADSATNCPWRFDTTPPDWSPTKEGPRGRDYYGGDLRGVTEKLKYLKSLGVTAIYFNPIFAAQSNHRYDTADYYQIDPALGTLNDFKKLVKEAEKEGIIIILDGVFNHLSSDSAIFDRYQRFGTLGACESGASPYRGWFYFRTPGGNEPSACAPSIAGGTDTFYDGWFGFDSIPVIRKDRADVQDYFINLPNSVSRYWLSQGARGWRMDVMGDASFPNGYWEAFRQVVKDTRPGAIIIGELWQKDSTLLRYLRGDRADTTMNYRMRDAVLGLLAPHGFDSKGFGDSGRIIAPSEFAARLDSIREDYPDAAYYSLMNLLGSHDTERILWTLTPGAETRADREFNIANVAEGKKRLMLAALIQFTLPGAPTVYYGDEVGVTGDDDPDDRRTFPWLDTGGTQDTGVFGHYRNLATWRKRLPVLVNGEVQMLLADDAAGTIAYARRTPSDMALVALNRNTAAQTLTIPVKAPNGTAFIAVFGSNTSVKGFPTFTVTNGAITLPLPGLSGMLLMLAPGSDVAAPNAPNGLAVTGEGNGTVNVQWNAVAGAARYNVYRSPLTGGGFVLAGNTTGTTFADSGLKNAENYFYVVRALDAAGNESGNSNEVSGLPRLSIGWANLQWPPTLNHTISATNRTAEIYGQVWIDGATSQPGQTPSLRAQAGYGPVGSNPATANWVWVDATFNVDAGNNDEFKASFLPESTGSFDYVYRYSTTNGQSWLYADINGPIANGALPGNPGKLTVASSGDTTAPSVPTNVRVTSASPAGIALAWSAIVGDASLYGYEVLRSNAAGGPYSLIGFSSAPNFTDTGVAQGATYYYVVRALDVFFNRSGNSAEVSATAELRTITLNFNVSVPAPVEDAVGKSVYIAGFLDRLDGGLPQWDPGGVVLTKMTDTLWRITLTGKEGMQIEYKYTLGAWDFVEKDGVCGETANRQLTLSYGATGTQTVNDTVANWRNVTPCGN